MTILVRQKCRSQMSVTAPYRKSQIKIKRFLTLGLIQRFVHSPVAGCLLYKGVNGCRDRLPGDSGDQVWMFVYMTVKGIENGGNGRRLCDVCFGVFSVEVPLQTADVEC